MLALGGSAYAFDQAIQCMEELQQVTLTRKNRFISLEWLADTDNGIPLIHKSELGDWNDEINFWTGADKLKRVQGRIRDIKHGGGIIDLNDIEVTFSPNKGGFFRDRSENELVEFFLASAITVPMLGV